MKNTIPSITLGLDLGDKKRAIRVLDAEGEIIDERTTTNHRVSLRRLSQKHPGGGIAFEVGFHSPWIKRGVGGIRWGTEPGAGFSVAMGSGPPIIDWRLAFG